MSDLDLVLGCELCRGRGGFVVFDRQTCCPRCGGSGRDVQRFLDRWEGVASKWRDYFDAQPPDAGDFPHFAPKPLPRSPLPPP